MKTSKQLKTATTQDFKSGTILLDSEGNRHIISDKYSEGIWNTKGSNVVFENEAKFYTVEK